MVRRLRAMEPNDPVASVLRAAGRGEAARPFRGARKVEDPAPTTVCVVVTSRVVVPTSSDVILARARPEVPEDLSTTPESR